MPKWFPGVGGMFIHVDGQSLMHVFGQEPFGSCFITRPMEHMDVSTLMDLIFLPR